MKTAATTSRDFRTFLLVSQFEAKAIGGRIARARDLAGLTQEEVAEMASFSKRSLQDYEAGVTIPYKHMREISSLLAKPVEWFLHGEPEQEAATADQLPQILRRLEALEEQVGRVADLTAQILEALAEAARADRSSPAMTGTDG